MTEKVKGVCLYKDTKKWRAQITLNKKQNHLGYFNTYEEAVKARKDAEIKYGFVAVTPAPKLKHKNDLTQEMLKERFHYDPDTGIFTWLVNIGNIKSGSVAGSINKIGYIEMGIASKLYLAHRLAFLYMNGEFPEDGLVTDHINHIKDDNRWENLRIVTHQDNMRNSSLNIDNAIGHTGVYWEDSRKKWRSGIVVNGETKFLGRFDNLDDAIAARKQAEIKYNFHQNHGKVA